MALDCCTSSDAVPLGCCKAHRMQFLLAAARRITCSSSWLLQGISDAVLFWLLQGISDVLIVAWSTKHNARGLLYHECSHIHPRKTSEGLHELKDSTTRQLDLVLQHTKAMG